MINSSLESNRLSTTKNNVKNNNIELNKLDANNNPSSNNEQKDEINIKLPKLKQTSITANQFAFKIKEVHKESDNGYSKLSLKDKISIVFESYSNEVKKQNKERGVSNLLTNITATAFASKVIPYILEKQTQKVKMLMSTTLLSAGIKAGYDETDRLSKDISDSVNMINNPKGKEDLDKAGEILAKSLFDMKDDLMVVLTGSVISKTKLPTIPKIDLKIPHALNYSTTGNITLSLNKNITSELIPKNLFLSKSDKTLGVSSKSVNIPSLKQIKIDIGHIIDNHTLNGNGYKQSFKSNKLAVKKGEKTNIKDPFPENMSKKDIEKAIKEAYQNCEKIKTQITKNKETGNYEEVLKVQGYSSTYRLKIHMYINLTNKVLDTNYPQFK